MKRILIFILLSFQGFSAFGQISSSEALRVFLGTPEGFSGEMGVLTPNGYVSIMDLRPGDSVVSWNQKHRSTFANRIVRVLSAQNQRIVELSDIQPNGRPIQSTPKQKYYIKRSGVPVRLDFIDSTRPLLVIRGEMGSQCQRFFTGGRGQLKEAQSGEIFSLVLENGPANFIVEGVLVLGRQHTNFGQSYP